MEIPSDNKLYLNNFEILDINFMRQVIKKFYNYLLKNDNENLYDGYEIGLKEELIEAFQPMNGLELYGTISSYLGSDKETSEFCYKYLKKIGIKYKSYGNTNIVMFNTNDINIIQKTIQ